MLKIKSLVDYELCSKPFFLIHQDRSVPSWLGVIITLLVYGIAIFLVRTNIREVFFQENPNIKQYYFQTNSTGNDTLPLEEFLQDFYFNIYEYNHKSFVNTSYFTPNVSFQILDVNGAIVKRYPLDIVECDFSTPEKPTYCFDKTNFTEKDLSFFLNAKYYSRLYFLLYECQGENCQEKEEILDSLKDGRIYIYYKSNDIDISHFLDQKKQGKALLIQEHISSIFQLLLL